MVATPRMQLYYQVDVCILIILFVIIGTWNHDAPKCVPIECQVPEEIDHGVIDYKG